MAFSIAGFEARAKECIRLANLTGDEYLKRELLSLRQSYLDVADRLRTLPSVQARSQLD
jgi:hypothetical protein